MYFAFSRVPYRAYKTSLRETHTFTSVFLLMCGVLAHYMYSGFGW